MVHQREPGEAGLVGGQGDVAQPGRRVLAPREPRHLEHHAAAPARCRRSAAGAGRGRRGSSAPRRRVAARPRATRSQPSAAERRGRRSRRRRSCPASTGGRHRPVARGVAAAALGVRGVEHDGDRRQPGRAGRVAASRAPASASRPRVSTTVVSPRPSRAATIRSRSGERVGRGVEVVRAAADDAAQGVGGDDLLARGSAPRPRSTCPTPRRRPAPPAPGRGSASPQSPPGPAGVSLGGGLRVVGGAARRQQLAPGVFRRSAWGFSAGAAFLAAGFFLAGALRHHLGDVGGRDVDLQSAAPLPTGHRLGGSRCGGRPRGRRWRTSGSTTSAWALTGSGLVGAAGVEEPRFALPPWTRGTPPRPPSRPGSRRSGHLLRHHLAEPHGALRLTYCLLGRFRRVLERLESRGRELRERVLVGHSEVPFVDPAVLPCSQARASARPRAGPYPSSGAGTRVARVTPSRRRPRRTARRAGAPARGSPRRRTRRRRPGPRPRRAPRGTRAIAEPPKPPPVIRAPSAPGLDGGRRRPRRARGRRSRSRRASRRARRRSSRPTARPVAGPERRRRSRRPGRSR